MATDLSIINMALSRIGAKTITAYPETTTREGVLASLFYTQTRDGLLRSFKWPFAAARMRLVSLWTTGVTYQVGEYVWYPDFSSTSTLYHCDTGHTATTWGANSAKFTAYSTRPLSEFAYQYALPSTMLRFVEADITEGTFAVEGGYLLSDEQTISIKYVKQVTDATYFDNLFVEVFALQLAIRFIAITGVGTAALNLKVDLKNELREIMAHTRLVAYSETDTEGQSAWNDAREQNGVSISAIGTVDGL